MRDINLKKILVIQTAFLGDVILATGVLEKLHEHYPDARLDMMVRKGNESLLLNHPYLNDIYVFNKKEKIKSLLKNIRKIRNEKYDLVINLQRFMTSGMITILSGAIKTIGFKKNPLSRLFSERYEHEIGVNAETHEIGRNHQLVAGITDPVPGKPVLYPAPTDLDHVDQYKGSPFICIAPASIWFTKQYPAEQWVDLINYLRDYKIFLLGAPGDLELCHRIKGNSEHADIVILAGKISLLQSAALMKGAVMNYVNDSAPMHLASATNAPVTAVYCSTIPGFGFGPLSGKSLVVETNESLNCRPCGLHGHQACPEGHFRCAKTIKTKQLLNSVKNL